MCHPPSLVVHFDALPDPRIERTKKYPLMEILVIALCAVICGAESFVEMEEFGHAKKTWLRQRLPLQNGIPSHDTFRRVFSLIDPDAFRAGFLSWTQSIHRHTNGKVIAIDGKKLRHSFNTLTGQAAIHMVSAWATQNALALGQVKVNDKSNEITAIPALLAMLDIAGCVVTIDAMGCQKTIAKQISEQEGDYVLALKGNQTTLHEEVTLFFEDARAHGFSGVPHSYYESLDKDHGRLEIRRCWLVKAPDRLALSKRGVGRSAKPGRRRERTAYRRESQRGDALLYQQCDGQRSEGGAGGASTLGYRERFALDIGCRL